MATERVLDSKENTEFGYKGDKVNQNWDLKVSIGYI